MKWVSCFVLTINTIYFHMFLPPIEPLYDLFIMFHSYHQYNMFWYVHSADDNLIWNISPVASNQYICCVTHDQKQRWSGKLQNTSHNAGIHSTLPIKSALQKRTTKHLNISFLRWISRFCFFIYILEQAF